ncbi:MAG: preprotein translocase subunit SecG [Tannerella sp.]|jgi:preprotein translocase subunit SecG|nr:preprotein translocase subunit SecG [Tannerella sp.]
MYVFLSILILISAIFLVLIVLVQNSKGGGLASGFASSNQVLGVRKTTDFLEKFTWGAAAVVVLLCIVITHWIPREKVAAGSEVLENVSAPVTTAPPDFGTALPDALQGQQAAEPQQAAPEEN